MGEREIAVVGKSGFCRLGNFGCAIGLLSSSHPSAQFPVFCYQGFPFRSRASRQGDGTKEATEEPTAMEPTGQPVGTHSTAWDTRQAAGQVAASLLLCSCSGTCTRHPRRPGSESGLSSAEITSGEQPERSKHGDIIM